jgi:hypothetical protein
MLGGDHAGDSDSVVFLKACCGAVGACDRRNTIIVSILLLLATLSAVFQYYLGMLREVQAAQAQFGENALTLYLSLVTAWSQCQVYPNMRTASPVFSPSFSFCRALPFFSSSYCVLHV